MAKPTADVHYFFYKPSGLELFVSRSDNCISFNTTDEFKERLNGKLFYRFFSSEFEISDTTQWGDFPGNLSEVFLKVIQSRTSIKAVKAPKGFFSPDEEDKLAKILANNKIASSNLRTRIITGVLGVFGGNWVAYPYRDHLQVGIVFGAIAFAATWLRQILIGISSIFYSKDGISTESPTVSEECTAFNSGVASKGLLGYGRSFVEPQNYVHPIAYYAGLRRGQEEATQHPSERNEVIELCSRMKEIFRRKLKFNA